MCAGQALLSYNLILQVCLRITLTVVNVRVKVNIMRITLHEEARILTSENFKEFLLYYLDCRTNPNSMSH